MRPINKRNFGYNGIAVRMWSPISNSPIYGEIVRQVGVSRYEVIFPNNVDTFRDIATLVQGEPTAPGQCAVPVYIAATEQTHYAKTITQHRVRTYEDDNLSWTLVTPGFQQQASDECFILSFAYID